MSSSSGGFDVAIIGSGPGGYVAAARAGQLGLKTAIIEKDKNLGGTCLLRGCIPTKALLHTADLYEEIQHSADIGIVTTGVSLDWIQAQRRKGRVVLKLSKGVEFLMKKNRVQTFKGTAHIEGKGKITVTAADGSTQEVTAKAIVIATGSVPRSLPGLEVDRKQIITSDEVLELSEIPKSMVVLGAGAVGIEFASMYKRFGTDVTVIELLPRVLPIEDQEISAELSKSLKKQGIKVFTGANFTSAKKNENGLSVTARVGDADREFSAEKLLVAVGRRAYTDGLGLENTKAEIERGYIKVDAHMRTADSDVYAIGDVVPTPQLAHVAFAEGVLAVETIAGKNPRPINYDRVPNCTYCRPEVASVGLTEAKARERGYDVKVGHFPTPVIGKAQILGASEGMIKIVADAKYDEVLGVHIIGPLATELIAEACAALQLESTVEEIVQTIHAHPTVAEAFKEAAEDVHDMAIHY
ncbi:MAG: dihydrolipoyl dehydrogenase [Blastocatellia bacterium AA13]|nr:MAG: dihydrolipoyl dehydrogenase [Blastocatellia bacterium AA13]